MADKTIWGHKSLIIIFPLHFDTGTYLGRSRDEKTNFWSFQSLCRLPINGNIYAGIGTIRLLSVGNFGPHCRVIMGTYRNKWDYALVELLRTWKLLNYISAWVPVFCTKVLQFIPSNAYVHKLDSASRTLWEVHSRFQFTSSLPWDG